MKRSTFMSSAFALAAAFAGEAAAQSSASTMIDEVVVTARRTEESAQTVPISLTAVSADAMRRNNVQSLVDIQRLAPGLTISSGSGGAAVAAFAIRGQTPADNLLTVDPAVGVYVDEILIPRGVGLRPAQFDLQSVQVLSGPQGTLFGKNTTGGAILLTTARPSEELGGFVDIQLTDYEGRRLSAAVNLPIIEDKLLARLAVNSVSRAGFGHDARGQATNDEGVEAIRASVIWRPAEDVEVYASVDDTRVRAHPQNVKLTYVSGCTGPNQCSGLPLPSNLGGPLPRYDANGALIPGTYGFGLSSTVFSEVAAELGLALTPANLTLAQNLLSTFLVGGPNDPGYYDSANPLLNSYDNFNGRGGTVQVNVDKLGHTFRSITGYRKVIRDAITPYSPFRPPGPIQTITHPNGTVTSKFTAIGGYFDTNSHSFTQEFQIQKQDSDFLDYTLGAFYQDEKGNDGGPSQQAVALSPAAVPVINDADVTNRSMSAYAQAIYHVTPEIRLTGGLRHTRDKKGITAHNGAGVGAPFARGVINAVTNPALLDQANAALLNPGENCTLDPSILPAGSQPYLTVIRPAGTRAFYSRDYSVCTVSRSAKFTSTNWLVGLDWRPSEDLMIYAKLSTGYKGGGFNLRVTNSAALQPFQPETTLEYEGGFKADWLDGRLRTNLSAYYTKYDDIQRNQIVSRVVNGAVGTATIYANAAKAHVYGAEAMVIAKPIAELTLTAGGAYTKGAYDSYRVPAGVDPVTGAPVSFNDLSFYAFPFPTNTVVPRWHYNLNAAYDIATTWGEASLNVNWSWQSAQPYHPFPSRDSTRIGAYGLLNTQAALHVDAWDVDLSVFVRNALNKKYLNGSIILDTSFGYNVGFTGEPRVVGLGVRKTFGGG